VVDYGGGGGVLYPPPWGGQFSTVQCINDTFGAGEEGARHNLREYEG